MEIQYTEIKKSLCIKHRNFLIFVFQYTEIQKYLCIEKQRFKTSVLADFFLKGQKLREIATDDENILGCESGDWVLPIYEKNRVRKSHATVPLKGLLSENK